MPRTSLFVVLLLTALSAVQGQPAADSPRSGVVEMGPPIVGPGIPTGEGPGGTNVNVTQDPEAQNETSIAADPADPLNLVAGANDYRYGDAQAGIAYSFDGGATWVADTLDGLDTDLGKFDAQGDPAIAAYRNGVFHYAFIDFSRTTAENRLAVATSFDGGVTWPQLGVIADHTGPGSHDFEDKEYIAVDETGGAFDGNVYVSWTRFPAAGSSRIMFSRSTDGGATFSAPVQISDSTFGYQGSVPAVGPDGELYVVWQHGSEIEIDKSTDGGLTWGADTTVAFISPIPSPLPGAFFRDNSFPTIAVDRSGGPNHGSVYVAWADNVGVGMGPDVLLSRSTDGGQAWSNKVRVSDDTNREYQWFPWISVDPSGNLDVVFFDRRDAPASTRYHTYHARSTDGGNSFGVNRRVSEEISESLNDGFGGGFIGDYNGIVSTSEATHPYWTDVRDSNANAEGYTDALSPAPTLSITGTCPGEVTVSLTTTEPNQDVKLYAGTGPGSTIFLGGPCDGVELLLHAARPWRGLTSDGNGEASFTRSFSAAWCDRHLQALDRSCATSNTAEFP